MRYTYPRSGNGLSGSSTPSTCSAGTSAPSSVRGWSDTDGTARVVEPPPNLRPSRRSAARMRRVRKLLCRGPAGEQLQPVLGRGAGFGGVGEQRESGIGRQFHRLVGELEVADHRMVQCFTPVRCSRTLCAAHRVRKSSLRVDNSPTSLVSFSSKGSRPAAPRRIATVLSAICSQSRVEVARPRVEEHEAGAVRRPDRVGEELRVQRVAEPVGGEEVQPVVVHPGRRTGHRVEHPLHARAALRPGCAGAGSAAPRWRRGPGRRGVRVRRRRVAAPGRPRAARSRTRPSGFRVRGACSSRR